MSQVLEKDRSDGPLEHHRIVVRLLERVSDFKNACWWIGGLLANVHKKRFTDNSQITQAAQLAALEAELLSSADLPLAMEQTLVKHLLREVHE